MSTHTDHSQIQEVYFCTLTCYNWIPLFELANAYQAVYTWFEHLKKDDCQILAYVIMPNHLHCLLLPNDVRKPLNKLLSEGKRFMAYGIVNNLRKNEKRGILNRLSEGVQENEKKKGKKHQVFRLSFDARGCFNNKMIEQKLDYIHHNPVSGKWDLVDDFTDYIHSSAAFYEKERDNDFVTHYREIEV